ncbi:hypothetical protein N2382_06380 [SAR92 clade bacterium H921]|nr:hypothetical protein [SAR92 clade bacterium H921]MDG1164423.1 hypothetical protein [Porticoccaceae bacterium]MDG1307242.1 hypothetical protein [Porticoccaceae bacterium]
MRVLIIILMLLSTQLLAQESIDPKPATDEDSAVENEQPKQDSIEDKTKDRDFKPSEEISEDFAVPLPADI